MELGEIISQYGFPIIAAGGLGYFIYFIWKWVTEQVDPIIGESHMTLIKLVDRVRMLDNDMIRLNTKLSMVLEHQGKLDKERRAELESLSLVSNASNLTYGFSNPSFSGIGYSSHVLSIEQLQYQRSQAVADDKTAAEKAALERLRILLYLSL